MTSELDNEQQNTLEKILRHPASGNVEWRQVKALVDSLGSATEEHNGTLRVTLGGETEVFDPPHGKDISAQMIVDLRRMLRNAGLAKGG